MKFKLLMLSFVVLFGSCASSYTFLESCAVVNVPLKDSVGFDTYIPSKKLTNRQLRRLKLHKIFSKDELKDKQTRISVVSRPKLSNNFKSVLFCSFVEGNQLSSILVNYSNDYTFTDYKLVAFAENSDGIVKTVSKIYSDSIVSTEYNLFSSAKSTLKFKILSQGKIIRD